MDPIQRLRDDHIRIEESLKRLEALLRTVEEAEPQISSLLKELRGEIDGHTYREDCLFPMLASRVGITGGPVQAVEHDHDQVEENLSAAEAAARTLARGRAAEDGVVAVGHTFVDELRAHFAREEAHLFPLADKLLNMSELRAVAQQMEEEQ
ncbi:MAG TPA: hemerythrin domain-containing protein [Armatimonadota bacterium]|jgi:hemerythrin-like domain-containing protein